MTILARCDRCGFVFPSVAGFPDAEMAEVFADNIESCRRPGCDGWATSETILDGVKYGIPSLTDVLGRLRMATPGELTDFAEVVRAVHGGEITSDEGRRLAATIRPEFAATFDWGAIGSFLTLLALIAAVIGLVHDFSGDAATAKAQATNERILAVAMEQLAVDKEQQKIDRKSLEVDQALLAEVRKGNAAEVESRQVRRQKKRAAAKGRTTTR